MTPSWSYSPGDTAHDRHHALEPLSRLGIGGPNGPTTVPAEGNAAVSSLAQDLKHVLSLAIGFIQFMFAVDAGTAAAFVLSSPAVSYTTSWDSNPVWRRWW